LPDVVIFQVSEKKRFVEFNLVRRFVIVTSKGIILKDKIALIEDTKNIGQGLFGGPLGMSQF
jgi:hypothetical protein